MIAVCGFQKSGNHWVRFVISNYLNMKEKGQVETLTWNEIMENDNGIHYTHNAYDGQGINIKYDGYPEFFEKYDKLIYIYRNPFDVMISYWHWIMNRDETNYELDLSDFTKKYLWLWINHVKVTRYEANLVLQYNKLRISPSIYFNQLLQLILDEEIDLRLLERSIEISSFDSIRKMSIENNEKAGPYPEYRGNFCRDGRFGQYKEVMSNELKNYIKNECLKHKIEV